MMQIMLSNHNAVKLEVSQRNKLGKFTRMWKLNDTQLSSQRVKEKIYEKLENTLKLMKIKNTMYQKLWDAVKQSLERTL